MKKRIFIGVFLMVICFISWAHETQAGFGISPPYIKSDRVYPGSHYEQIVTLLRSSAEDELIAEITINAPEIEEWITIDKGLSFTMPEGEFQVPMLVSVDIPENTEVGTYTGHLNIRITPKNKQERGGVAIALGARVEIELAVTKDTFKDFLVRTVSISDVEMLKKPWNWKIFSWFFYRVNVVIKLENLGNIDVAPTKVLLDVYDITEKKLLESGVDTKMEKIEPFKVGDTVASFRTKLGEGQYWGKIKIYKENEVVRSDKLAFTVAPAGSLNRNLGPWPRIMLSGIILIILLIIIILIKIKIWRYIYKILYILSWPLRYLCKIIKKVLNKIKVKFWSWLHHKSAKYKDAHMAEEIEKTGKNKDEDSF